MIYFLNLAKETEAIGAKLRPKTKVSKGGPVLNEGSMIIPRYHDAIRSSYNLQAGHRHSVLSAIWLGPNGE